MAKNKYIELVTTEGAVLDTSPKEELSELDKASLQKEILAKPQAKYSVGILQDDGTHKIVELPSKPTIGDIVGRNYVANALAQLQETLLLERSKIDGTLENFTSSVVIAAKKRSVQDAISELIAEVTNLPKEAIVGRLDKVNVVSALVWYFHFFSEFYPKTKDGEPKAGK